MLETKDMVHDLAMLYVSETVKHDPLLTNPEQIAKMYYQAALTINAELKKLRKHQNT